MNTETSTYYTVKTGRVWVEDFQEDFDESDLFRDSDTIGSIYGILVTKDPDLAVTIGTLARAKKVAEECDGVVIEVTETTHTERTEKELE